MTSFPSPVKILGPLLNPVMALGGEDGEGLLGGGNFVLCLLGSTLTLFPALRVLPSVFAYVREVPPGSLLSATSHSPERGCACRGQGGGGPEPMAQSALRPPQPHPCCLENDTSRTDRTLHSWENVLFLHYLMALRPKTCISLPFLSSSEGTPVLNQGTLLCSEKQTCLPTWKQAPPLPPGIP